MDRNFIVTMARFHRSREDVYVLQGYFEGNSIAGSTMRAYADHEEIPLRVSSREGLAIRQKYFSMGVGESRIDREYDLWITLPPKGTNRQLRVYQDLGDQHKCVFHTSFGSLERQKKEPDGYLETWREENGVVSIGGWAVGREKCEIVVEDGSGSRLDCTVTRHYRPDIAGNYPETSPEGETDTPESFGFEVSFPKPMSDSVTLVIECPGQELRRDLKISRGSANVKGGGITLMQKTIAYLKRYGLKRTLRRTGEKLSEKMGSGQNNYMRWRKKYLPTQQELQTQSRNTFLQEPLISIVVPLYRTKETYLRALVDSVKNQTYKNWQLCLSDGSGSSSPLKVILQELAEDPRIRICLSTTPLGIAENTNTAMKLADGAYLTFADHDDLLDPSALYEFVKMINREPDADFFYSDEDKISMDGREYFQPHFKPDYCPDMLCSVNYICHMVMVKRSLYEQTGPLNPDYDGAQDYDFVLRATERARKIVHIPKPLYHWRSHQDSTAENPASKLYAFEAGMRAIQAHYDRLHIDARVEMGPYPGLYRTRYGLPSPGPLISIIIPNKDHIADLDQCVQSILEKSAYRNFEFVIVENNSCEEETFTYYRKMEQQSEQFRVLYWEKEFNFSLINNFGAQQAGGEYLLFLNNDTQALDEGLLGELLGPCLRSEVGAVGARLLYPDGTVQHAGVVIGYGGIAGHAFAYSSDSDNGYFSRSIIQCNYSAVTAACMMVKKSVFEELGGFDGELRVAFNDIDFCLRLGQSGRLVVYNPYARMIHYESKSRGYEDTPEKIARFNREANEFLRRWKEILENGDPCYNPNLSLDRVDFALKK